MMEIDDDDLLRTLAAGGSMDFSVWPALLPRIVSRVEKIAHDEFPIPTLPPPQLTTIPSIPPPNTQPESETTENFLSPLPSSPPENADSTSSQDTNKENSPVAPRTAAPPPTSAPAAAAPLPPGTLPPQIIDMLTEITTTLTSIFPTNPPHSIQRLSELVLNPKSHYRSLVNYLHALDRVVHVTSGLNIYPLPPIHSEPIATTLPNGLSDVIPTQSPFAAPGSDEALGGALLTPIPWLQPDHPALGAATQQQAQPTPMSAESAQQAPDLEGEVRTESTETIEGPNGVGSIETVSVSVNGIPSMGARGVGVTQGELLRQEQRAGVVPVSQLVPSHHVHPGHQPPSGGSASAAAQQQVQARIQQQQQQAQAQAQQARTSPSSLSSSTTVNSLSSNRASPDSSTSAQPPTSSSPASSSVASSNTLEERGSTDEAASTTNATTGEGTFEPAAPAEDAAAKEPAVTPVHSTGSEEDEKPHARGPEEIGADDLGPQSATSSGPLASGPGGVEMQGIDIQAAVGRKADNAPNSEDKKSEEAEMGGEGNEGDKMDVDEKEKRGATPKREAEDEPEGAPAATKKIKEDSSEPEDKAAEEGKGKGKGTRTEEEAAKEDNPAAKD